MTKHSARLNGKGYHELEVIETTFKNKNVSEIILNYPDKNKRLSLRPTKGYKIERVRS